MATKSSIYLFRGEDVIEGFTLADTEDPVTGQTLVFIIVASPGEAALATLSCTVTATRAFEVAIPGSTTAALPEWLYFWEVRRTEAGFHTVLAYGPLFLSAAATTWS